MLMPLKEFAIGIPSKKLSHELPTFDKPKVWEFAVHDHAAEKRGRHFDLRLGDPETGRAHSWAMHASWPEPGEKTWAIAQPTHTVKYMDFQGTIPEGYGKGGVKLHDRDRTEVMKSSPGHINFNIYRGSGPEEYTLHRVDDKQWILMNRTLVRKRHPHLPSSKPIYKEVDTDSSKIEDPDYIMSAKVDDAHNLFYFPASGENIRVISYRPSKKTGGGIIEHTHKVPGLLKGVPTPEGFGGTILRGGLYAMHPATGEATPSSNLASLLNSDVWKSREKQQEYGELLPILYDVVQYRGKKMENAPYEKKLEVLRKIEGRFPDIFHLPLMATSLEDKQRLLKDIKAGNIPETKEGVVLWNMKQGAQPIKIKFTKEHDVYVRDFFPGEGKYRDKGVGGFLFSHEPDGPIVGRVGTGLSDIQRLDMFAHPDRYVGIVARVKAQGKFPSGALRSPAHIGWHLDKNEPAQLDLVKYACFYSTLLFLWGGAIE